MRIIHGHIYNSHGHIMICALDHDASISRVHVSHGHMGTSRELTLLSVWRRNGRETPVHPCHLTTIRFPARTHSTQDSALSNRRYSDASMCASSAPLSTVWPGSTRMRSTMPSIGAWISFSIFIASRMRMPVPFDTLAP